MRVAIVTNVPTYYRLPVYERLGRSADVDVFFTARSRPWYWAEGHGLAPPAFRGRFEAHPYRLASTLARGAYDCVVASLAGRATLAAAVGAAAWSRVPLVLWVGVWEHPLTPFHVATRPLTRWLYRRADAILVYGPHVAEHIRGESGRVADVFEVGQAVDNDAIAAPRHAEELRALIRRIGARDGEAVVTFVGRIDEGKGVDVLVDAIALLDRRIRLVVAGDGPLRPTLEQRVARLGLTDRVSFLGHVDQRDVAAVFQVSQVVVVPSVATPRFREPWGLVVNEAMANGLPIVATTAVGAAAAGFVDETTGIVVPENDAAALAAAIDGLAADPQRRAALGAAALERVRTRTFDASAASLRDVVESTVARRRRRRARAARA